MHIGTAYLLIPIRIQHTCLTYQNLVYLPLLSEFSILALPIRIERGNFKNKQSTKKNYLNNNIIVPIFFCM
jgi:hypothetical protein